MKSYDEMFSGPFTPHPEVFRFGSFKFEAAVKHEEPVIKVEQEEVCEEEITESPVEETMPAIPEYVVTQGLFGKTKVRRVK